MCNPQLVPMSELFSLLAVYQAHCAVLSSKHPKALKRAQELIYTAEAFRTNLGRTWSLQLLAKMI